MINHPNCDGPLNTIGPRGCYACDRVLVNENDTFADCLELGKLKCPRPEDGKSGIEFWLSTNFLYLGRID